MYKEGHLGQGLQPDFHPLLRRLYRLDSKFSGTSINPDCNPFLPFLMINQGGYVFFPCPLESTRATDLDFHQWFAGVVFPRNFLNPFYAILEDLILSSNVPPVVTSVLLQILLVH